MSNVIKKYDATPKDGGLSGDIRAYRYVIPEIGVSLLTLEGEDIMTMLWQVREGQPDLAVQVAIAILKERPTNVTVSIMMTELPMLDEGAMDRTTKLVVERIHPTAPDLLSVFERALSEATGFVLEP